MGIGTDTPGGLLGLKDKDVHLDVDGDNNLKFTDAKNKDGVTLSELSDSSWSKGHDDVIYYNDGNVGIGTSDPAGDARLDVDGHIGTHGIHFQDNTTQNTAADTFPSGAVIFMMNSDCPDHWKTIDEKYMGRFIVITPKDGTTPYRGGGSPLKDKEAPKHTHPIGTSKKFDSGDSKTASWGRYH